MKNKTIFLEIFGDSPTSRVLDYLIENDSYDHSKTDIFRETGVARTTLQEVIERMLKNNIIIKTREVGRASMYKLNRDNPIVEEMVRFAINAVISVAEIKMSQKISS